MTTIITKNSSTSTAVPAVGDLQQGELAVNVTDKKVYTKDSSSAIVKLVGSLGNQEASNVAITGGSVSGITDLAVTDGGTGSSTAAGARSNLGAAASGANSDITSLTGLTTALSVAQGGTGVTSSTGTGSVVLSNSPTLVTPTLGTPASATLTNATGLPIGTGVSGLGTGVATALAVNVGSAGAPVVNGGVLGTPSSGTVTNLTGTASININGTVGATTASTGAFTTLSASSTVTLSGGTANGVAYLNGSKVLTTDSALAFDGSNVTANGSFTSGTTGVAGSFILARSSDGAGTTVLESLAATNNIGLRNTVGSIIFSANNSEGMRLTSTGLGIGTTTPAYKLDVVGTAGISGNLTLSGGTANGVAYLNGSKVLTSGSALTFDGTNLGVGVTPSAWTNYKAFEIGALGNAVLGISGSTATTNNAYWQSGSWKYAATGVANRFEVGAGSGQFQWFTAPSGTAGNAITFTQAMTLNNSGNLGIGTSSPATKLHILTDGTYDPLRLQSTASGYARSWTLGPNVGANGVFGFYDSTAASLRMSIDTSGNLGLGVTPSAWSSPFVAFQIATGGATLTGRTDGQQVNLATNWRYTSGSNLYIANGYASRYAQESGGHYWFTAPSGTAGNAITFTQAMTLDASGNLGVGTTSPAGVGGALGLHVNGPSGASTSVRITNGDTGSTATDGTAIFVGNAAGAGTTSLNIYNYESSPIALYTGGTERARIASGGNLLLGTTVDIQKLSMARNTSIGWVNAAGNGSDQIIYADSSSNLSFYTGASERARIDSSGNLLLGATSTVGSAKFYVLGGVANFVSRMRNSDANPSGVEVSYTTATINSTGNDFLYCADATALRAEIRSNGGLANYSANNVNLSDRREKTNFAPAGSYLEKICAIPVQTFNYVDQNLEEDDGLTLGVVAQDVQAVAPELVTEGNWGTKDEPKMRLSIYQTDLQYALMKALQELKAEFDAYKASHP